MNPVSLTNGIEYCGSTFETNVQGSTSYGDFSRFFAERTPDDSNSMRIDSVIESGLEKIGKSVNDYADKIESISSFLDKGGSLTPARSLEFLSIVNTYSIHCHCINSVGKSIGDGMKTLFRNQ